MDEDLPSRRDDSVLIHVVLRTLELGDRQSGPVMLALVSYRCSRFGMPKMGV